MPGLKEAPSVTEQQQRILNNRNVWNDPELASQDRYPVLPEPTGEDRPDIPYSEV